jgi:RNA polymerase sigma-70 factor (ECF subfamily)
MLAGISERAIRLMFDGILPLCFHTTVARDRTGTMQDEQTLLNALQDLDPQAITQIHNQYFPVVYRYARYRMADDGVAEDLASETFFRLLEAIHAGRGPQTSLRGWLMGTVSNLVNNYYRKIYNRSVEPLHERLPSQSGDPVAQLERLRQVETLQAALTQLTPDQQHVLALRFGSGCSLAETGELMGRKPNAVKQLQFRALAALRKCLQGEFE